MDALSAIVLIASGLILAPFVITALQMFHDVRPRDPYDDRHHLHPRDPPGDQPN